MNHGGGAGFYIAILLTELPTTIKIIFSWAVALIPLVFFKFHTKFLKIPPDFSKSVGMFVSK
jgi:hypothetical protein